MILKESAAVTSVNKEDIHAYINRNLDIFEEKKKKGGGHYEWWVNDPETGERLSWPSQDSENFYGKGRKYGVQMSLSRGSGETRHNEGKLFRDILHLVGRLDDFPSLARQFGRSSLGDEASGDIDIEPKLLPNWTRNIIGMLQSKQTEEDLIKDPKLIYSIRREARLVAGYLTDDDIKELFNKVKEGYRPSEISEAEVLVAIQLLNLEGSPASRSEILDIISKENTKENINDLSYNIKGLMESEQVTGEEDSYETPLLDKNSDLVLMKLRKLAKFLRNK